MYQVSVCVSIENVISVRFVSVIPAFQRLRQENHEYKAQGYSGLHSETLSPLKNKLILVSLPYRLARVLTMGFLVLRKQWPFTLDSNIMPALGGIYSVTLHLLERYSCSSPLPGPQYPFPGHRISFPSPCLLMTAP